MHQLAHKEAGEQIHQRRTPEIGRIREQTVEQIGMLLTGVLRISSLDSNVQRISITAESMNPIAQSGAKLSRVSKLKRIIFS